MLEILFLIWLSKKLSFMAVAKNRSRMWGLFGVCMWILGELAGFALAADSAAGVGDMYIIALVGAGVGALVAFVVVSSLSKLPPPDYPTARVL